MRFEAFFEQATDGLHPYDWQTQAAEDGLPDLISVPTGMGKTEGVVLAWAWRALVRKDSTEPNHIAYCLPMRVLVRQTAELLRDCFVRLRDFDSALDVGVFTLMGGQVDDEWVGCPDRPWVLVGTQDQLLSRALNRGYAMSRFDWPMHFGLLNNDCRWIVDEVQLMGPGVWTTAQLDWMRRARFGVLGQCPTTWMSATLGADFLATTDRKQDGMGAPENVLTMGERDTTDLSPQAAEELQRRSRALRPVELVDPPETTDDRNRWLAEQVADSHAPGTLSLVVCNTVTTARAVYDHLRRLPSTILLTSRFRPRDRAAAEDTLREFEGRRRAAGGTAVPDDPGLVCVSTQVVEAGVDLSAHRLWSEIAPWPSVVQRLGRLNRDGRDQDARAAFWSPAAGDAKSKRVGPYAKEDVALGGRLLAALQTLSASMPAQRALAELAEGKHRDDVVNALRIPLAPMPRAFDLHGLFATDRDVHGGFTDVSAFVRDVDPSPDVTVVWREWAEAWMLREPEGPPVEQRDEGCPVRIGDLRAFLKDIEERAFVWDDDRRDRGAWVVVPRDSIQPGMLLMLPGAAGGYDPQRGWTGDRQDRLTGLPAPGPGRSYSDEHRSETSYWSGLEDHLRDAQVAAEDLTRAVGLRAELADAVVQAAALHDLGKAHPQWQHALPAPGRLPEDALGALRSAVRGGSFAKTPHLLSVAGSRTGLEAVAAALAARVACNAVGQLARDAKEGWSTAWLIEHRLNRDDLSELRRLDGVTRVAHVPFRPGLRHEAVTALAMWSRHRSDDPPWPALAIYLAAAHHGKVRTTLHARSPTGDDVCGVPRGDGVTVVTVSGQDWPLDFTVAVDGAEGQWTEQGFILTGHGWTGLVADLLGSWRGDDREPWLTGAVPDGQPRGLGPFRLAYLEALVRIADWRASDSPSRKVPVLETPT